MQTSTTARLTVPEVGAVDSTFTQHGEGHPVLLLHGGGGPMTVTPFAEQLADSRPARVVTPTHPGWNGTPRPEALDSIPRLAATYVALLDALDLDDVTVVGSSMGGWITAEMALLRSPRVSSYVLLDAVGIEVPGHPVADFFSLTFAELAQLSYADPATYAVDPAALPEAARTAMAGNRAALMLYAGRTMTDPSLAARLHRVDSPALVVWGEADRICDPELGRAYAAAMPAATFTLVADAGHLPQIEAPAVVGDLVWRFADTHATARPRS